MDAPFDLGAVVRQVHFAFRRDGSLWRGGHATYDVQVGMDGMVLRAYHHRDGGADRGARPIESAPFKLGDTRVLRGGKPVHFGATKPELQADGTLKLRRAVATESLINSEDGVEQTWTFDERPPGAGELTVELPVLGLEYSGRTRGGLHFRDPKSGLGFRYGDGLWIDARGKKTAVPATFDRGRIVLRLGSALVEGSAYPALLDPKISPEVGMDQPVIAPDETAQQNPAVASNGNHYLVVWEDNRLGAGFDVWGVRVSSAGALLEPTGFAICAAGKNQRIPSVSSNGTDFFIAWFDDRNGTTNDIYGARVAASGSVLDPAGIPISTAPNQQLNPSVASNGSDYFVAWHDLRNGAHYDIYGARVTSGGSVVDTGGIAISTAPTAQTEAAVASRGGEYLVVWQDPRSGTGNDVYGARVSAAGAVLDASGIPISTAVGLQNEPSIASNGTHYLVAWTDSRSGTTTDIYAARVSGAGTVLDSAGIAIASGGNERARPSTASNGTDFLVAWRDGPITNYEIHGARVSSAGALLDTPSVPIATAIRTQDFPSVASNGTDYFVVWQDQRNFDRDAYASRVTAAGSVLDSSGIALSQAANLQYWPSVASNGGQYVVVWSDARAANYDIYGVRISSTGALLDSAGILLSSTPNFKYEPSVASNGTDYFVAWHETINGAHNDIHGVRLSAGGTVLDTSSIAISSGPGSEGRPVVASDGADYFVAWEDPRNGALDVYGARVTSSGTVLDSAGIAISTATGNQQEPSVASDGTDYLVAWTDSRSGTTPDVYGARITSAGTVLDSGGLAISTAPNAQMFPAVGSAGSAYFVAWQDRRNGSFDLYGARVTSSGSVLDASGVAISAAAGDQQHPSVTSNGTEYFVAWQDDRNGAGSSYEVYVSRVSTTGTVLDAPGIPVGASPGFDAMVSTASAGGLKYLVAYRGFDAGPAVNAHRILARLVDFGPNSPPAASSQVLSTLEDTPKALALSASDPDGDLLTYTVLSQPSVGALTGIPPNLLYTPPPNFAGPINFEFLASDGAAASNLAAITINVIAVNDAPVALAGTLTTLEDSSASLTLSATDPEGDPLVFTVVAPPAHGTLSSGSAAARTYTPHGHFSGMDSFTYKASDGLAESSTVTVSITVTPVNDAPVAMPQALSMLEDASAPITLSATDVDGDPLAYQITVQPQHGTLSGTPPAVVYTPAAHYSGADSFTYLVSDGVVNSAPSTVSVTIDPVNDAPSASAAAAVTAEDTPTSVQVAAVDADGDQLSFILVSPPSNGTLIGAWPAVTYVPATNFNGTDAFMFKVSDGVADSALVAVPVTVTAVNDVPSASALSLTTNEDTAIEVTLTASDVEAASLSYVVVTQPSHGTLSGLPPNLLYTPSAEYHGADQFSFTVTDGVSTSPIANADLIVASVNDAPAAQPMALTVDQGVSAPLTLQASDVDGDALSYNVVLPPLEGVITGTPPNLTYLAPVGFRGDVHLTFTANDGLIDSAEATVTITINNGDPSVTASAELLSPKEGQMVKFSSTAADPDGDILTFTWDFGDGETSTDQNPTHVFDDEGPYTVSVEVSDGVASATDKIELVVENAAPIVVPDSATVHGNEGALLNFVAAVQDPGSQDTVVVIWDWGDGTGTSEGATATHVFADDGTYQVTVTATDSEGASAIGTRDVVIKNVPPVPRQQAPIRVAFGEQATATLTASDRAGERDPLTWSLLEGPGSVGEDGAYAWTADAPGTFVVKARVSDGDDGFAESVFSVEVAAPPEAATCTTVGGNALAPVWVFALLSAAGLRRRRPRSAAD